MKEKKVYIVRVGQGLAHRVKRALDESLLVLDLHGPYNDGTAASFTVSSYESAGDIRESVHGHSDLSMISCEVTSHPLWDKVWP